MTDNKLLVVARIYTPFNEKFGIPRQSGLAKSVRGEIHLEGEFCNPDAVRGIEEFSHLWLLWGFTEARQKSISMTVAPPRLGGNVRKGVFATRSPFRPNSIGLSSVRLEAVEYREQKPVLIVSGADILNGTPIYDIKPYLPYTDSHPDAQGGFAQRLADKRIEVVFPEKLRQGLPEDIVVAIEELLSQDPRAAYNKKPDYVYGISYADYDIRFTVADDVVTVVDVCDAFSDKVK